jgi:hypothetical protein
MLQASHRVSSDEGPIKPFEVPRDPLNIVSGFPVPALHHHSIGQASRLKTIGQKLPVLSSMMVILAVQEAKSALDVLDLASAYQLVYGSRQKGRTIAVDKSSGGKCLSGDGWGWLGRVRFAHGSLPFQNTVSDMSFLNLQTRNCGNDEVIWTERRPLREFLDWWWRSDRADTQYIFDLTSGIACSAVVPGYTKVDVELVAAHADYSTKERGC